MRKHFNTHFKKTFTALALCLCAAGTLLTGSSASTIGSSAKTENNLQIGSLEEESYFPNCPISPLNDDKDDRKDID